MSTQLSRALPPAQAERDEMKLLPCAHCGSPAEEVNDARYGWYVVACMNEDCGITMSEVGIESQAEANAIWNRRAEIAERDELP